MIGNGRGEEENREEEQKMEKKRIGRLERNEEEDWEGRRV